MSKYLQLILVNKKQITEHVFSFYFDRKHQKFEFLPGQYMRVTLPHNADNFGTTRFFTISSSPLEKDYITITTKINSQSETTQPTTPFRSSFKTAFANLKKGDSVQFFGPMGKMVLDQQRKQPLVFLSGGMGITPFYSMITYAVTNHVTIPMTLFASWRTSEDMLWHDLFQNITAKKKWFTYVPTLTRLQDTSSWVGEAGRINKEKIEKYSKNLEGMFYVVGPPRMVEDTQELLLTMGISEEKILKEIFTGYE